MTQTTHPADDASTRKATPAETLDFARSLITTMRRPDAFHLVVDTLHTPHADLLLRAWGIVHGVFTPDDDDMITPEEPPMSTSTSTAAPTPTKSYETQPVGYPGPETLLLDDAEYDDLLDILLDAVRVWEPCDHVLPNERAYHRLARLATMLARVARGYDEVYGKFTRAHHSDERAAEEWKTERWLNRSRLADAQRKAARDAAARTPEPAGSLAQAAGTLLQDAQTSDDAPDAPDAPES